MLQKVRSLAENHKDVHGCNFRKQITEEVHCCQRLKVAESDKLYEQAKEIVEYTKKVVELGKEPLEDVSGALEEYAEFLESHGKP